MRVYENPVRWPGINEKEMGEGFRASGVPGSEIFVRRRFHFPTNSLLDIFVSAK